MKKSRSTIDLRVDKLSDKAACPSREFHSEITDRKDNQKTNFISTPLAKIILPELDDTITSDSSDTL